MSDEPFAAEFQVAWADLDSNNHAANTAYLDWAAQTRFLYFATKGFLPADFAAAGIGPAAAEDRVTYRRELRFMDKIKVTFTVAGASPDFSRFEIVNRIIRKDGEVVAEVRTRAGWMSLAERRIAAPPKALADAMAALAREPDFAVMEGTGRPERAL